MNQPNNEPSELETRLSSNAIDAVAKAFNLSMSPQKLEEFKQQTVKLPLVGCSIILGITITQKKSEDRY